MRQLKREGTVLLPKLEVAESHWSRMKGLLGRTHLPADQGLWLPTCSIHTFFMKFPIDLVFLNRKLQVIKTYQAVKPGRIVGPVWRASSVLELSEGFLAKHPLKVGEQLHVDPALS